MGREEAVDAVHQVNIFIVIHLALLCGAQFDFSEFDELSVHGSIFGKVVAVGADVAGCRVGSKVVFSEF